MAITKSDILTRVREVARGVEERGHGPAWAAIPTWVGGASLVIAVTGLFWDIAYHIDHGRDVKNLFTVPHLLILFGLLGLGFAAVLAIIFATAEGASGTLRFGRLRVPFAALPMLVMAGGAVVGFPLDDLWHRTYGIDVTLWSPTHLLMLGGAIFATLALNLLMAEGQAAGKMTTPLWQRVMLAGSVLIGLSGFGLEFDYGVPQWQALYQPLLIAIAAGFGLTLARASMGRGGALLATGFYFGLRLLMMLLVWRLGYTVPLLPLLFGCALCVEAAFLLEERLPPLAVSLLAGVLVATLGLAGEWAWNVALYPLPWTASLLPRFWVPMLAAVVAAVAGTAFGRVVGGRTLGFRPELALGAVVVAILLLAIPFPRGGAPIAATLTANPVGPQHAAHDRYGQPSYEQDMAVTVQLADPSAVEGADWFTVQAWQGGGRRLIRLVPDGPGRWRTAEPVPTGGAWKSIVFLAAGGHFVAAPIYFPPDPTYGLPGISADPVSKRSLEPAPRIILSEVHGGPPGVAVVAYLVLAVVATGWFGGLALATLRLGRGARGGPRDQARDAARARPVTGKAAVTRAKATARGWLQLLRTRRRRGRLVQ